MNAGRQFCKKILVKQLADTDFKDFSSLNSHFENATRSSAQTKLYFRRDALLIKGVSLAMTYRLKTQFNGITVSTVYR